MVDTKQDEQVEINFESHPPIEEDLNGIATLLRQTLLNFIDCHSLASYLIQHKDQTQVIAQEEPDEEDTSEDNEPDDDIYGVCSVVELPVDEKSGNDNFLECRRQLLQFVREKNPKLKEMLATSSKPMKIGFIVNERYINLPPQLSLPAFKTLTKSFQDANYTHFIFVSKILLKSRSTDTKVPSKKSKSGQSSSSDADPLVFVNAEEEIISEESENYSDLDVSAHCDENASWSFGSDIKYIPHRRFILVKAENWPNILKKLEEELHP